jgi:predicted transposase YbfD/YdcC
MSYDSRTEKGHHRVETRKVWAVSVAQLGGLYKQEQWAGLRTIVIVERVRHLWNKTTREVQFYLSSLPVDAQLNGRAIRQHWGIENQVHWSLDVTFNEDKSRIRSLNSPQNFALVRRIALNAVNQETSLQRSLRQKIKRAAMNNDYMMQILKCFCQA